MSDLSVLGVGVLGLGINVYLGSRCADWLWVGELCTGIPSIFTGVTMALPEPPFRLTAKIKPIAKLEGNRGDLRSFQLTTKSKQVRTEKNMRRLMLTHCL